jgi:hypothetical protein
MEDENLEEMLKYLEIQENIYVDKYFANQEPDLISRYYCKIPTVLYVDPYFKTNYEEDL